MFSRKGQLQIQETILVLFIFIVILVLGMVFFYRFSLQGLEENKLDNERLKFNTMLSTVPEMAEITCSIYSQEVNCIDVYKLLAFKNINDKYMDRMGFMNITIYSLYPERNGNVCELGSVRDCGIWNIYYNKPIEAKTTLVLRSPVSLYYIDKYGIGEIVMERYL